MVRALLVIFVGLVLGGCSAGEKIAAARSEAARFHSLLNAGKYGEIYAGSSPELKAAETQEHFVTYLTAVHRKLGAAGESSQRSFDVNVAPDGTQVALNYRTRFAKGDAAETFVFSSNDNATKLVRYSIDSEATEVE